MSVSFHLNFDGHCEEAMLFYQKHFGGSIVTMLKYKDSPMVNEVSADWRDKIIHASITIGGIEIVGADCDASAYKKPQGFAILIPMESPEQLQLLFDTLRLEGAVVVAPQTTFWSPCYAIVIDKFGILWKLNCAK